MLINDGLANTEGHLRPGGNLRLGMKSISMLSEDTSGGNSTKMLCLIGDRTGKDLILDVKMYWERFTSYYNV